MSNRPLIHPEYATLEEEASRYATQISALLEERDHLRFHIAPALQMMYLEKVGQLEYQLFELECETARIKRTCEMMQACINQQKPIDLREIEQRLDEEYASYMERLQEMAADMERMNAWKRADSLTAEQAALIKKLYKQLVKWLHPDVNPDLKPTLRKMWKRVMSAYEENDLEMLTVLHQLVLEEREKLTPDEPLWPGDDETSILEKLRARKQKLHDYIQALLTELDEMQEKHPYMLKVFLEDEVAVKTRQAELHAAVRKQQSALAEWKQHLSMFHKPNNPFLN